MKTRSSRTLALIGIVALGVIVLIGATSPSKLAAKGLPNTFAAALADHGIITSPLSEAEIADILSKGISPDQALDVADEALLSSKDGSTVYLARVTKEGMHVGDETTPLRYENVPMYVVQRTGVEIMMSGGVSIDGKPHESSVHHEQNAFVDAYSGDWLFTSSFR